MKPEPLRTDAALELREWRFSVIRPALAAKAGTSERASAVREIAGREHYHPVHQRRERVPERTIQRWIERYGDGDMAALGRSKRTGTAPKLILTRKWDQATAHLDPETRERIAAEVRQDVRDLWASNASLGDVMRLASERLQDLTAAAGFAGTATALVEACALPRPFVERDKRVRRGYEFKHDRKAFEDARPRIRRSTAGIPPMGLVLGDVHHTDTLIERADGTTATPKLIAWKDVGTRRVRWDVVLCDAGTSIRNADLIASFLNMVRDPAWGMSAMLYLDNGSEYLFAEFLKDAMQLTGFRGELLDHGSPIVKARPYNAQAKGLIEGAFGIIERTLFASLPGYIGGDRMKSKTANVGRAPTPYGLGIDAYRDEVNGRLGYYNSRPQSGGLKGLSPNDAYHSAVRDGWTRTTADENALFMAFSTAETRIVRQGKIEAKGGVFYCPELFRHEGERVTIRLPKYTTWNAVPVFTMDNTLIGVAQEDAAFPFLSRDGAVEASERERAAKATVKALAATARPLDLGERMRRSAERAGAPKPAPIGANITLREEDAEIGRAVREAPGAQHDREHAAKQARLRATVERRERMRGLL
ncbi:Mu transposase C-terminal domain-containing protein [Methylorubrum suomiense]|uniref:Mu transposase C-terminal domain-containing protein n=1 Tax=Methylorubrum suomiense TaxID=144191 RepID=UPI001EE15C07|nr:Mu transposase C-terminal domain-containing protein [Methylorubrum suomiense]